MSKPKSSGCSFSYSNHHVIHVIHRCLHQQLELLELEICCFVTSVFEISFQMYRHDTNCPHGAAETHLLLCLCELKSIIVSIDLVWVLIV